MQIVKFDNADNSVIETILFMCQIILVANSILQIRPLNRLTQL